MHLILIDENLDECTQIIRELQREFRFLDVKQPANFNELQQILEASNVNLVITDYQLSWTTGLAVLKQVKEIRPECPVLMFTSNGSDEIAVAAMKAGLDDYITKSPYHYTKLATTACSILEQLRYIKQHQQQEEPLTFQVNVLSRVSDVVIAIDNDYCITYWNEAAAKLYNFPASQALGQKLDAVFHYRWLNYEDEQTAKEAIATRGVWQGELIHIKRNGETLYVEASVSVLSDESGHKMGWLAVIRDVTPAKQAKEALIESEKRFSQMFYGSPIASVMSRLADGHITEVNDYFVNLFGYSRAEAIGCTSLELGMWVNPQERDRLIGLLYQWGSIQNLELQIQKKSGEKRDVLLSVEKINLKGESYLLSMLLDITERKQVEQERENLLIQLEQRVAERTAQFQDINAELESFSYTISHDLRAPLRTLEGFANALAEDCVEQLNELGQEYIQRIVASTQWMDRMILDLLAYSRISRTEVDRYPVSLEDVVMEVLDQLKQDIEDTQAQITVGAKGITPLPDIVGHRGSLIQAVSNLLTNALKFVPSGVQPQVQIWAEDVAEDGKMREWAKGERKNPNPKSKIRLWVEDNGFGIKPEHQERIFKVFERLHGQETYPGTGIGLAIVRKAMERMGGRVGVESSLAQGSRFWLEGEKPAEEASKSLRNEKLF